MPRDRDAATPVLLKDLAERERAEQSLDASGRPIPLHARAAWAAAFPSTPTALAVLRAADGTYAGALSVSMHRSRALPAHELWRVERIGEALDVRDTTRLLQLVVATARKRRRVLRLEVSVIARSREFRRSLAARLASAGFGPNPTPRTYDHTLVLDLGPEHEMLAALSRQTRRNVRGVERQPLAVRPITDSALVPRMAELMRETLARTGGHYKPFDWGGAMRVSTTIPERSRLVGMFRTDLTGPEALLAFSWGMHHGDHAVYDAGASTRATGGRTAVAYPLLWDLITWAGRGRAKWFDFGGVSRQEAGAPDPLAGISDFKRSFSRQVEEVGDEYILDMAPMRNNVARVIGGSVRALRSLTASRG